MCILCGRRLIRASAIVPARGDIPEGAVGPTCARKAGLIAPARLQLFARKPRQRVQAVTPQMELPA
jgi:hypothetical protein